MQINDLYLVQLLGCVSCGGFIGEFYRSVTADSLELKRFLACFLSGSFLSFFIAYAFYLASNQRELTMILGALLSYQDERFLSRITARILKDHFSNRNGGEISE